jgi:hypothetical protein
MPEELRKFQVVGMDDKEWGDTDFFHTFEQCEGWIFDNFKNFKLFRVFCYDWDTYFKEGTMVKSHALSWEILPMSAL